jgi:integrase
VVSIAVHCFLLESFRTVPYERFQPLADITRKKTREALEPRREPYWLTLAKGCAVGFRRGPDTWIARYTARDGSKKYQALPAVTEYHPAKKAAEEWLAHFSGSPVRAPKRDTVRAALEAYLEDLRRHGRPDAATEALWRFKLCVYRDPLADLKLETATSDDFLEWRDRLRKGREPRTINRNVRAVVAGLNRARQIGHVGNPDAWKLKPLQDDVEDEGDTAIFLSPEQRKAIIEKARQTLGDFLRGLELTGARPKELAAAKSDDFDGQSLRLAHRKGRPPKLRVRHVVLGADGVEFFKRQAKDKVHRLLGAPSFPATTRRTRTRRSRARRRAGAHVRTPDAGIRTAATAARSRRCPDPRPHRSAASPP